jgi:hypothetical protein
MSLRALSHGWELRLTVGSELIHSQVVRSPKELADVQDQWKTAWTA